MELHIIMHSKLYGRWSLHGFVLKNGKFDKDDSAVLIDQLAALCVLIRVDNKFSAVPVLSTIRFML